MPSICHMGYGWPPASAQIWQYICTMAVRQGWAGGLQLPEIAAVPCLHLIHMPCSWRPALVMRRYCFQLRCMLLWTSMRQHALSSMLFMQSQTGLWLQLPEIAAVPCSHLIHMPCSWRLELVMRRYWFQLWCMMLRTGMRQHAVPSMLFMQSRTGVWLHLPEIAAVPCSHLIHMPRSWRLALVMRWCWFLL